MLTRQRPLLRDSRVFGGMRLLGSLVFVLADHGLYVEDVEPLVGLVPLGALAGGAAAFGPRPFRPAAFEIALAIASRPATGPLTFSAGLVELEDADDPAGRFALAERAPYEAKASGRNTDRTRTAEGLGALAAS